MAKSKPPRSPGRPKGRNDIASEIRGAFRRACLQLEQGGKPLSTIILKKLEEDPLATLRAISAYVPAEHVHGGDDENPIKHIFGWQK